MYYHSPSAFRYLRNKFDDTLPHPSTLRKWYGQSDISGEPGILSESLKTLKSVAEKLKAENKKVFTSLAFDEMSIKRHILWLHERKSFLGFAFDQEPNESGEYPVASKVLVFMITVLNASVSIPVAYFCVKSLNAREKRVILSKVLSALHEIGVKVVNIVFDGDPVNIAMCELMGANLDPLNATPYIFHPEDDTRIYILFDACHMLKLIRSTLGDNSIIHGQRGKLNGNTLKDWWPIERRVAL